MRGRATVHSDPRQLPWPNDVFKDEAEIVLPALLRALSIDRPVLIGHSDGGTIATRSAGEERDSGKKDDGGGVNPLDIGVDKFSLQASTPFPAWMHRSKA